MHKVLIQSVSFTSSLILLCSAGSPALARNPEPVASSASKAFNKQQSSDFTDALVTPPDPQFPYTDPTYRGGLYTSDTIAAASIADQVEAGTFAGPADPGYIPGAAGDTGDDMVLAGRPNPLPRNVQMTQGNSLLLDYTGLTATTRPVTNLDPRAKPMSLAVLFQQGGSDSSTGRNLPTAGSTPPTYGAAFPWEGSAWAGGSPAARGYLNTQTGNRLTVMPLTGWHVTGDLELRLSLYHNSQDHKDIGWGMNWRSSYDMRVIFSGPSSNQSSQATVSYPNGRQLVYTKTSSSGGIAGNNIYYPPTGFYDALVRVSTGWTLRTLRQITYFFDSAGYLTAVADRYGNRVFITRQTSGGTEYITQISDTAGEKLVLTPQQTSTASNPLILHYTNVTAPANNVFSFTYSNASTGQYTIMRSVQFPALGGTTPSETFYYDYSAAITQEIALDGRSYYCAYDGQERLTSFSFNVPFYTNPMAGTGSTGRLTYSYQYGTSSTVRTDPYGYSIKDTYNGGLLFTKQDEYPSTQNPPKSFYRQFWFDLSGNLIQIQDRRGNSSYFSFDKFSNLTSSQDPNQHILGVSELTGFNPWNDPTTRTDARGNVTTYSRDPSYGTLLSVQDALTNTTETHTYNSNGTLASTTTRGGTTTYSYNNAGRRISVMTPNQSYSISYSSSQPWLPLSIIDSLSRQTTFEYDAWGRKYGLIRADSSTFTQHLDPVGRVLANFDGFNHATTFSYDAAGRKTAVTNSKSETRQIFWWDMNRVAGTTDANSHTSIMSYTVRGEPKGDLLPDNSGESCAFDANGNQTIRYNGLGQQIVNTYDAANNLTRVSYPNGATTTEAYDSDERLISMSDSSGTTSWSYDAAGRTTNCATPQGSVAYSFDQWGRETQVDEGGGVKIQKNYRGTKVSSIIKLPENETTSFTYDGIGRPSVQTFSNGAQTVLGYDSLDRVNALTTSQSGGLSLLSESYSYNANGDMTSKTSNGQTTSFTYDYVDQLLSEVSPNYSENYTYDHNGNRLTRKLNSGTPDVYSYDAGDKLTQIVNSGAVQRTYTYDSQGRTTSIASPSGNTSLSYDYEDRITSIAVAGAADTFTYNGFDARVSKVDSSGSSSFLRHSPDATDGVLADGFATYVPGLSRHTSAGTTELHSDSLGSIRLQTDASQNTILARSFDAFGLAVSSTGNSACEFGFAGTAGYQEDTDTGLKLLGHRYYDPSTGRFLTRDRLKVGRNWYGYVNNNPLTSIDPSGHITFSQTEDNPTYPDSDEAMCDPYVGEARDGDLFYRYGPIPPEQDGIIYVSRTAEDAKNAALPPKKHLQSLYEEPKCYRYHGNNMGTVESTANEWTPEGEGWGPSGGRQTRGRFAQENLREVDLSQCIEPGDIATGGPAWEGGAAESSEGAAAEAEEGLEILIECVEIAL